MNEHGPLWPVRYEIRISGEVRGQAFVTEQGKFQRWLILDGAKLTSEFSLIPVAENEPLSVWQDQIVPALWKPESLYALVESHAYRQGDELDNCDLSGDSLPEELPLPIFPTPGGGASLPVQPPGGSSTVPPTSGLQRFFTKPLHYYYPGDQGQLDVGFYVFTGGRRGAQSGYIFSDVEDEQMCMGYQSYNVEYWLSSPVVPEPTKASIVTVQGWQEDQETMNLGTYIQMVNDKELWVPGARLDILGCRYYRGASVADHL